MEHVYACGKTHQIRPQMEKSLKKNVGGMRKSGTIENVLHFPWGMLEKRVDVAFHHKRVFFPLSWM